MRKVSYQIGVCVQNSLFRTARSKKIEYFQKFSFSDEGVIRHVIKNIIIKKGCRTTAQHPFLLILVQWIIPPIFYQNLNIPFSLF